MVARIVPTLILSALNLLSAAGRPPQPLACSVDAQPRVTSSPLRYLRIRSHVLDPSHWWVETLYLVGDDSDVTGPIQTTQLCEADACQAEPPSRQVEWKTLSEGAGQYEVQLVAATRAGERCFAKSPISVIDSSH